MLEVEKVKKDDFIKVSTFKKSVRDISLVVITLESIVLGVIHLVLFGLHCRCLLRVHRRPLRLFMSLGVIFKFLHFHRDVLSTLGVVLDVVRLGISENII